MSCCRYKGDNVFEVIVDKYLATYSVYVNNYIATYVILQYVAI